MVSTKQEFKRIKKELSMIGSNKTEPELNKETRIFCIAALINDKAQSSEFKIGYKLRNWLAAEVVKNR